MTDTDGTGPDTPDFDGDFVPADTGGDDVVAPGLDDPVPIIEQGDDFVDDETTLDEPVPSQPAPTEPRAETPPAPDPPASTVAPEPAEVLPGFDEVSSAEPQPTSDAALGNPTDDLIRADAEARAEALAGADVPLAPESPGLPVAEDLPGLDEPDLPPWPSDDELDLPAPADPESSWKLVPPANGMIGGALLAAAATALVAAAPAIQRAVTKTNPSDAASAVAVLNDAGVDARLEHGDLDTLERALAADTPVLLTGEADGDGTAPVLHLVEIDRAAGTVSVAGDDAVNHAMALAVFAQLWDDTARQVIVTSGDRPMLLLPVAAGWHQLAAARPAAR